MIVRAPQPLPSFDGSPAYIIGGGPSLRSFAFRQLVGRNTLGCNYAFTLGHDICKVLIFGDVRFYADNVERLQEYQGPVVTNCSRVFGVSWIHHYRRVARGILPDSGSLTWHASTGAAAIHMALKLGADTVYLMGYDMAGAGDRNNWHVEGVLGARKPDVYARHRRGLESLIVEVLPRHYPGCRIVQLTSPDVPPLKFIKHQEPLATHFAPPRTFMLNEQHETHTKKGAVPVATHD